MVLIANLRLVVRLISWLLVSLILLSLIAFFKYVNAIKLKEWFTRAYYYLSAISWGIRVEKEGSYISGEPLLVVSNHCSYTDIPVLGCCAPVHFTPKSEISNWPVIGYLCRLSDCIFIDRNPRKTAQNMVELDKAVGKGWMISLFPEGTTNNGTEVLPFRSSYFSLAEKGVRVQPVTVSYFNINGTELSESAMRKVAWIGDDEFAPHLIDFLKQPAIKAVVKWHDVVDVKDFANRKELASHCHKVVANLL